MTLNITTSTKHLNIATPGYIWWGTGAPGRLLFDVDVEDGVCFMESETIVPGSEAIVADTPLGAIGMSICYDLRFPSLYQRLVDEGAQILAVPSAFTHKTGTAHWHVLLRARAIENQAWVIAPGQVGHHDDDGLRHLRRPRRRARGEDANAARGGPTRCIQ